MPLAVASLTSICSNPVLYELMTLRFEPALSITWASILSVSIHRMPALPATFFNISSLLGGRSLLFSVTWHSVDRIERAGSSILLVTWTLFFFLLTAPLALSAFALLFNYNLLLLVQIYV